MVDIFKIQDSIEVDDPTERFGNFVLCQRECLMLSGINQRNINSYDAFLENE